MYALLQYLEILKNSVSLLNAFHIFCFCINPLATTVFCTYMYVFIDESHTHYTCIIFWQQTGPQQPPAIVGHLLIPTLPCSPMNNTLEHWLKIHLVNSGWNPTTRCRAQHLVPTRRPWGNFCLSSSPSGWHPGQMAKPQCLIRLLNFEPHSWAKLRR